MASHKQITDRDMKVKGVHIVERNEILVKDTPKRVCISAELEELHEMHNVGFFVQRTWMQFIFGIGPEDNTRAMPASRLIHPLSNFGIAWVFTTAFFLVYTAIVTPPIISFSWLDHECSPNPTLYFDVILDIFFLLDIVVAFNTGVKITGDYIDDRKTVAKIYVMSGALLFDLVTSFPVSFFELAVQAVCTSGVELTDDNSGELKIIRAIKPLRWFKIVRLMKLGKFGQTLDLIMDSLGITPNLGNVLKSYSTFVLMIHLLACIWWLWKVLSQTPEETLLFLDDISWGSYGRNDLASTQGKIEAYVIAVYITAQTLTTVGYGDITPENTSERVGYTLFFVINAFLWGNVLAEITSIHQADNEEKRVKMEFLQNTAQFLIKNDCPARLRTQIIKWARINAEHKTEAEGKKDMIHKLPSDLQKGLVFHLYAKEVSNVPVFRFLQATTGSDGVSVKRFLSSVFAHLEYKMYMPGEVLVNFSSPADRLIFFINSIVEVQLCIHMYIRMCIRMYIYINVYIYTC
jgi:hyperpolarization activated cyclic nucleotide-gated potassium channel 2